MKNFLIAAGIAMMFAACSNSTTTNGDKDAKVSADSTQIFNLDTTTLAAGTVYYQCPMTVDAEIISDKPGACPKCGMDIEPVTKQ